MTLAEQHYRKVYKKPKDKFHRLDNDEYKIVNMMHECLREYNTPKLPVGTMLTKKSALYNYMKQIDTFIQEMDELFKNDKTKLGRDAAKLLNKLQVSAHSIKHFEMKIPLDRLNEEITEDFKIEE